MVGDLHPGEWPMRGLPGVVGGLQRGELPQPPDPSKLSGLVGGRRGLRPGGGVACVFGILAPSARGRQAGSCRWDFGGWLVAEAGDYGRGERL